MRMPSAAQRRSLARAAATYQEHWTEASGYLADRGITEEMAGKWRLGVVRSPEPNHEAYVGRLAIPYINYIGVVGFKFRCIRDHDCKTDSCDKYMCPDGQPVFLFNMTAVDTTRTTIHITEGEIDCLILSEVLAGEPVVGIPGAKQWPSHWTAHFRGFERVLLWSDGDRAGREMVKRVREFVPMVERVPIPSGHDVNSLFRAEGAEAVRGLAKSLLDEREE